MKTETTVSFETKFEEEVFEGLTAFPKFLSSKYFYDKKGDKLFQDIMALPEYYLTNCEFDILSEHTEAIARTFNSPNGFDLIELGAGDGKKTKILLRHLSENNYDFNFLPIDISQNVLDELKTSLEKELPNVEVRPQQGTYFEVLERLAEYKERKKVIMVLGSNIGNLLHPQAILFLKNIRESMVEGDLLFMGFDQKKDPQTILDAYNDKTGVTAAFNKNILVRINREMQADFDPDNFLHWETYDPETGTAKSFLVAKKEQSVFIGTLGLKVHFKQWETIHTEISQKYDDDVVEWLAKEAGLQIDGQFTDNKEYYKNYIFTKS
ncbi:L-histidine N(alpha)-methyltransferase [Leptobacterium flavescens]|uniref:L-histidine N(Alpha)-methyltransferase n=1 Tax=Leptobacterium flavescens TaxID=472055 RepID=A0A6P0UL08_9FLAO|nr:L-histidine N(alpha)-methyltransferase [Leptobacterium flavescens]NER12559.1 L-histidine N(alpha)-methyltransferase [Leptobacterium flavescens]